MSNEWIQLVLVRLNGGPDLFRAPFSSVGPGDLVRVETRRGETQGTVLMGKNVLLEHKEHINAIVDACGASWPLKKVLARIEERTFTYEEDDHDAV